MIKPAFNHLDANFNTNSARTHPCTMPFNESSAIRMCEALVATDERFLDEFKQSSRTKCPHGFIKGALDLAEILSQPHLLGITDHQWSTQRTDSPPVEIYGKRGIIVFINIPEHPGQGHFDLWDDNTVIGNDYWDAESIWMWDLI